MKKILLVLIVLKATQPCFSQGTLKITTGTTFKAKNGAHIVVNDMNLKNNATIQQAANDATFDFKGNTNDTISGTGNTIINTINLAKKAGSLLTLQRNISIVSQVIFLFPIGVFTTFPCNYNVLTVKPQCLLNL